ncbi:MAG: putative rhodanese-like protein [candidate division TM6 bacterium GW2011_GWF2_30_66]|jgi:rhodanese-related sulfurtransferase|nr:MAG: putative rhodanese-like protein [candidate division TM6 bacterium GW2011_GWF2_30_66]
MFLNKSVALVAVSFLVLTISSCWKSAPASEKKTGLVLVNVLDKEHFDDCSIKGSVNIVFDKIEQDAPNMIDKDAEVVVFCSNYMCGASSAARDQLINMGYKKVYAYEGGVAEWFQKGYPVDGQAKKGYLNVKMSPHADVQDDKLVISAEELKKKLEENKKI